MIDYSLYLVSDRNNRSIPEFIQLLSEAIAGGITLLQLREKNLSSKEFYELAKEIHKITSKARIPLIINDRIDIALAIQAEGVHLGQSDMPVPIARKILGKSAIIGVTAKTIKQAQEAEEQGANYLGTGAMFPSTTKPEAKPISFDRLSDICRSVSIPVVAIGGITDRNLHELAGMNIAGVAVSGGILNSTSPCKCAKNFNTQIKNLLQ